MGMGTAENARVVIGVDPGASGGIVVLAGDGRVIQAGRMPECPRGIYSALTGFETCEACMEFVHSSPQMGVASAFTFGKGAGWVEGVFAALGINWTTVLPKKWQTEMGIPPRGQKTTVEHKNVTKAKAQELFPHLTVTHATADALLIAEYYRRKMRG